MGACFDRAGRRCCDKCDKAGGARVRKCPAGYCPAPALCGECWALVRASGDWARWHADCPAKHAAFVAAEAARAAALEAGAFLVCSAMSRREAGGLVQVCFRNKAGAELWCFMPSAAYGGSGKLGRLATPADYEIEAGGLLEAPAGFYGSLDGWRPESLVLSPEFLARVPVPAVPTSKQGALFEVRS
jgi:hypothetical protein